MKVRFIVIGVASLALVASFGCGSVPEDAGETRDPSLALTIDAPSQVSELPLVIAGWGADLSSPAGSGVDRVEVLDGGCNGQPIGVAEYGLTRADVADQHGAQFIASGWRLTLEAMSAGEHRLGVRLLSDARPASTCETVTVTVQSKPMLSIEAPTAGVPLMLPIRVGGWAVDLAADTGTGVLRVDVLDSGCNGRLLGTADYGITRGDVAERYGHQFGESGWELVIDDLSEGAHTLGIRLASEVTGATTCQTVVVSVL